MPLLFKQCMHISHTPPRVYFFSIFFLFLDFKSLHSILMKMQTNIKERQLEARMWVLSSGLSYPKYRKGGAVAKEIKIACTYGNKQWIQFTLNYTFWRFWLIICDFTFSLPSNVTNHNFMILGSRGGFKFQSKRKLTAPIFLHGCRFFV